MFADTTAYILTLPHAGPVHDAATANLDIHFLARPQPVDVVAQARLLRLGRRLCVCAIDLHSGDDLVAHATVAYSLPSARALAGAPWLPSLECLHLALSDEIGAGLDALRAAAPELKITGIKRGGE